MKESLFSYLVSYVPTDKRESTEDYLTQMFAWILQNIEGTADTYVQFLCEKGNIPFAMREEKDISISTQTTVPNGRIDLLITVNREVGFICEHKVHSELSENQIKKYMDDSSLLGNEKYYSVLLTFSALQHTQEADVSIVWSDIYDLFEGKVREYDAENCFVLNQFLKYLTENGMGKAEMIPVEAMLGYWPAINLESQLESIFRQLADIDFETLCPGIEKIGSSYAPTFNRTRWGRIGIDFFKTWNLGLFVGVLLQTFDHPLEPKDTEKGPDFVIFLESEYAKNDTVKRGIYEKNIHSTNYSKLCTMLSGSSADFDFLPGIKGSPWRIAVLRIPLFDILYGTYKKAEQVEAIKNKMVEGIDMLLGAWSL